MLATEQETESYTAREVADLCHVTIQTVNYWILNGVRKCGVIVQLEAEMIGGRYRITQEALERFRRRCDRRTWSEAARQQDAERRQAKRDKKRFQRDLGDN